jgi:hypothetical protein
MYSPILPHTQLNAPLCEAMEEAEEVIGTETARQATGLCRCKHLDSGADPASLSVRGPTGRDAWPNPPHHWTSKELSRIEKRTWKELETAEDEQD